MAPTRVENRLLEEARRQRGREQGPYAVDDRAALTHALHRPGFCLDP